jgi:CRISPR/Cas system-associated exonuclease Cas4 (RecB family)
MPTVSYSEASSYLLCKRKHFYGYTKSLERITTSSSLALGSAGHRVLDAFYTEILAASVDDRALQLAHFDIAVSKATEMYQQLVDEGFTDGPKQRPLAEIIFKWYLPNEPLVQQGWLILAAEKEFVIEYADGKHFPFIIDLIANDPMGKTVVVDHKFVYDFYGHDSASLQPQIPLYMAGLRGLGYKVAYGAYNMLRNRKMKDPTLEQSIELLPLKPNGARVQRTFVEQMDVADEIMAIKELPRETQDLRAHRVANKMVCQSCSFKDLCITDLSGGNVELMEKLDYKIRTRKTFAIAQAETDELV